MHYFLGWFPSLTGIRNDASLSVVDSNFISSRLHWSYYTDVQLRPHFVIISSPSSSPWNWGRSWQGLYEALISHRKNTWQKLYSSRVLLSHDEFVMCSGMMVFVELSVEPPKGPNPVVNGIGYIRRLVWLCSSKVWLIWDVAFFV